MKAFLEQVKAIFLSLPRGRRIVALCLIGSVVVGSIYLFLWINKPNFRVLYSNLTQDDAGIIVSKLKEKRVPYQLSENGSAILVPEDMVYELRLTIASEGLPKAGTVGFEIFDETNLGTTEFVQKLNYQRALQGELARTIAQFPEVECVRVHLVTPKDSLFIEDQKKATASVVLNIKTGMTLKPSQIEGIVYLVASAIEGLEPEHVTIVDTSGRLLYRKSEDNLIGQLTNSQLEYQKGIEENLQKKVQTMLERVIGVGKAIVRVFADIDFQQVSLTEELYDPDSAVPRSRQVSKEFSERRDLMAIGKPEIDYENEEDKKSDDKKSDRFQRQNETVNYEINKVSRQITGELGKTKRLSVAVVIDGNYSEEQMSTFTTIVKRAVGFDEEREDQVEVSCIPFAFKQSEDTAGVTKDGWKEYVGRFSKPFINGVFVLLLFLFVVRPLIKYLSTKALEPALPQEFPAKPDELELEMPRTADGMTQAVEIAKTEPKKTVELIRTWLSEER